MNTEQKQSITILFLKLKLLQFFVTAAKITLTKIHLFFIDQQ